MSKRKLLLADDSVTIQKVVNLTFADEGIEVIAVGDGNSAMQKITEIAPDLIMADVNMPGLTGYEICERIRRDENLSQTPVILLVGSFEPFDENEALRVGANDYLTKPFQSIRQLVNKVTALLDVNAGDAVATSDVSSIENNLETDAGHVQPAVQYSDTSYDDEMIQTNKPSVYSQFDSENISNADPISQIETPETVDEPVSETFNQEDYETEESWGADEVKDEESSEIKGEAPQTDEIADEEVVAPSSNEKGFALAGADEVKFSEPIVETAIDEHEEVSPLEVEQEEVSPQFDETTQEEGDILDDVGHEVVANKEVSSESVLTESAEAEPQTREFEVVSEPTVEEKVEDEITVADSATDSTSLVSPAIIATTAATVAAVSHFGTESDDEIPLPETPRALTTDDDDLLQLPPIDTESDGEVETVLEDDIEAPTATVAAISPENLVTEPSGETTDENPAVFAGISPELIDHIVEKVIARMSDTAIREVAWEVVPQMTEQIVTKMAEEKLKE